MRLYRRADGQVGIRNELWILPTVGCVNAMAKQMQQQLERECDLSAIDGVHLFSRITSYNVCYTKLLRAGSRP